MHVIQIFGFKFSQYVVDGRLEVFGAGQSVAEPVSEVGQLGPRPALVAVVVADVRQHGVDDGPVAGDFRLEGFDEPAPVEVRGLGGCQGQQQQQNDDDDRAVTASTWCHRDVGQSTVGTDDETAVQLLQQRVCVPRVR